MDGLSKRGQTRLESRARSRRGMWMPRDVLERTIPEAKVISKSQATVRRMRNS